MSQGLVCLRCRRYIRLLEHEGERYEHGDWCSCAIKEPSWDAVTRASGETMHLWYRGKPGAEQ